MLSVTDEGAFALLQPEHCYACKIVQRNGHYDKRHKDRIPLAAVCLLVVSCFESQGSNEKTDNKRAGVACVYFCGREIEQQKTQKRAYEDKSQSADKDLPADCSGNEQD